MRRICVIGGGLGGLTAARALVAAGFDAHVLEASPRAGGVLGTSRVDGYLREHAASSFLGGPADGALALCTALGVAVDPASRRARRRWIYLDGKLRSLPRGPLELVRSDLLTWRGKLDLLREPLRPGRPQHGANGADESMHDFAARRFGAETARAIVAPFVTGVFAADAHDISLEAGFPRIAALDVDGGVIRGMIRRAVRGIGKPKPRTTARGMWAPRGGLGVLTEALARELGARVRTATPVARIAATERGVVVDGEPWDGAVLAVPAEDAAKLVAHPLAELASRLAGFHRAPTSLVYLGYPAPALPRAIDGFGFLVAQGEGLRVLGVVFESIVWPDRAPDGHVLLRCIVGGARDPEAARLDDAELIAQATRDIATVLGATSTPTHASVVRWTRGVAQYRIGHAQRVREAVVTARGARIALAGADYRGPGVNDLCADAATVVEEVAAWT